MKYFELGSLDFIVNFVPLKLIFFISDQGNAIVGFSLQIKV